FVSLIFRSSDGPSATPVDAPLLAGELARPSPSVDVTFVEVDERSQLNVENVAALRQLGARSLIVARFRPEGLTEAIIARANSIPVSSTAVILNAVPEKGRRLVDQRVVPALEAAGLTILGIVPQDRALLG